MEQNKGNIRFHQLICKGYCPYCNSSSVSNNLNCYGFIFVQEIIQKHPQYNFLLSLPLSGPKFVYQYDPYIFKLICQKCNFLKTGCDFRSQRRICGKKHCAPCGGYIFITRLIANKFFMFSSKGCLPVLRPILNRCWGAESLNKFA